MRAVVRAFADPFSAMRRPIAPLQDIPHDAVNAAEFEISRARVALTELGMHTTDAKQAWRINRAIEAQISDLQAAAATVNQRYEKLEHHK